MSGDSLMDRDIFSEDANIKFANQDLERVSQLIVRLDSRLKNDEPDLGNLCTLIHRELISNSELAYMLKEEEIKVIVQSHIKLMNAEIVKAATKRRTTKADMKNISVDDL